jgi:LmbE family N-acetylglucosaminyl deacetylase
VAQCDRFQAEIMDRMAQFLVDYAPHIVFIHWPRDTHADHRMVAKVSRHILGPALNMIPGEAPNYKPPVEVYAYQTGVSQAYGFIPDLLVKTDETTFAMADRCVDCFKNTAPNFVPAWKQNFHTKAAYWGNLVANGSAEAFKFLGPRLPLTGFRLKEILGDRLEAAPLTELYHCNQDFWL